MNKKIKIACFLPFSHRFSGFGGAERRIPYIFSKLDYNKYDVTIVITSYKNREKIEGEISKYLDESQNVIYLENNIKTLLYFLNNSYDIVCYTDCILRTIPTIFASLLKKSKRIMLMESVNNSSFNFKKAWYKYFFDMNIKLSNHLDCLYPSNIPIIKSKFPKAKITITPSILPRIHKYSRIEEKKNIILFAGRLIEQKNPRIFIDSMVNIRKELLEKNFKCWICGEGPLKNELISYIKENGYEDIIEIKGYLNMENVTIEAKIFCSLQNRDNYPSQSLLEAIASGCYCIASNLGDTRIIVKDDFGKLVDLNEISISSAVLEAIKKTNNEWNNIESKAKEFANINFNVDKAVQHYDNIFENMVRK